MRNGGRGWELKAKKRVTHKEKRVKAKNGSGFCKHLEEIFFVKQGGNGRHPRTRSAEKKKEWKSRELGKGGKKEVNCGGRHSNPADISVTAHNGCIWFATSKTASENELGAFACAYGQRMRKERKMRSIVSKRKELCPEREGSASITSSAMRRLGAVV